MTHQLILAGACVRPPASAVGTSGRTAGEAAAAGAAPNREAGGGVYTLTGPLEKSLKREIGRQVTIVGTIENAGERDTGADVRDVSDLPRIEISTWHPVGGVCPGN